MDKPNQKSQSVEAILLRTVGVLVVILSIVVSITLTYVLANKRLIGDLKDEVASLRYELMNIHEEKFHEAPKNNP